MTDVTERVVPFTSGDDLPLNLVNVRGSGERGPVLVVHGAGVSATLFRPPVKTTFVDALVEAGYDVWLENWRASDDVPQDSNWTLDDAARFDHPEAVKKIIEETGCETMKAVVHCQGSTSFTMSAVAGLVPSVDTIVSSAVALHPVVPRWSRLKLKYAIPASSRFTDAIDPSQGDRPKGRFNKLLTAFVRATHRECDVTACRMVSFTYGAGFPALWRHENINDETHDPWIQNEFTRVPLTFFSQMAKCVAAEQLVTVSDVPELPARFADQAPETDARFAFFAGEKNRCFLPESQRRSHAWFNQWHPGRHSLHVIPGYSHLDLFFGDRAAEEVYPLMLAELEGQS